MKTLVVMVAFVLAILVASKQQQTNSIVQKRSRKEFTEWHGIAILIEVAVVTVSAVFSPKALLPFLKCDLLPSLESSLLPSLKGLSCCCP